MTKEAGRPLLALETATMCGSVALVVPGHCLAEYSLDIPATHSRTLLPQIDAIRAESGLEWHDLSGIAVSMGPGSFTGLRIGLSVAKGLALSSGLSMFGIPTLEALARQIPSTPGTRICALLDARKKEVYAALFETDETGVAARITEDMVVAPQVLAGKMAGPVILVGDGAVTYREVFTTALGENAIFAPTACNFPRGASVGMIGLELMARKETIDPTDAVPFYVRASEAEINLRKKPTSS